MENRVKSRQRGATGSWEREERKQGAGMGWRTALGNAGLWEEHQTEAGRYKLKPAGGSRERVGREGAKEEGRKRLIGALH